MAGYVNRMLYKRLLHQVNFAACSAVFKNSQSCFPVLRISRMLSTLNEEFEEAKRKLNSLKTDPGNVAKLKIYGLFKQATVGKCNVSKPGVFDLVGKAKWEAWNGLGDMSQDEAKKEYIKFINTLTESESDNTSQSQTSNGKYQSLMVIKENKVTKIILNRPQKKNAITIQMYDEIIQSLDEASNDDTVITVITGAGDYYSSGNDLSNFAEAAASGVAEGAKMGEKRLKKFVSAFIDFPKPLVALVNGPAVGISVTVLGLFDIVYASDKATFHTPFSSLGQSPEGCSSYVFPRIMGTAKANELLMFNKKITAKEACDRGLVSEVFPDHVFQKETDERLKEMSKCPIKSLQYAKLVYRNLEKDVLHKINDEECRNLVERWQSEDCMNAISSFFSKKS